jgi:trk system potassium uptake protein TrkH
MHFATLAKFIGLLLMVFSLSQLPPVVVDLIYREGQTLFFLIAFVITLTLGLLLYFPFKTDKHILRIRESIFLVVSFWLVLSLIATIPFMLSPQTNLSFVDSLFESMSGLSTTGATIITGLDELPKAILYYRQQLQWFGGMGIIVLAVAILPIFGISNLGLFQAETSNLSTDRITPKLAQTAKSLWLIYLFLTIICAIFYYLAGMDAFDAISHSFSTIAIGGFSTHDASIGYFNSPSVEIVAIVFMLIAGVNFSLHFMALHKKSLKTYFLDSEFKTYIIILAVFIITTILVLENMYYDSTADDLRYGIFQVVSMATTTGFTSTDFSAWPLLLPFLLILASFVGACSGSTGGGIKVVRILLMIKLGMREIKKLIHPSAQINIKLGGKTLPAKILISVWGFFALYVMSFTFIMVLLMFSGLDQVSSFAATAATINNLGPGLGEVAHNYQGLNDFAKGVLVFAMLLGRLEILTLLAIFHRAFWRF